VRVGVGVLGRWQLHHRQRRRTDASVEVHGGPNTDTNSNANSYADFHANGDTNSDVYANGDTDVYTYADTNSYSNADCYT
jgi:hypothetical protein